MVCSEAVLPMSITAIVTTGGSHKSSHARWGKEGGEGAGRGAEEQACGVAPRLMVAPCSRYPRAGANRLRCRRPWLSPHA